MSDAEDWAVQMLRTAAADGLIKATEPRLQAEMVQRVVRFARRRAAVELRAVAANYVTRQADRELIRARAVELEAE